MAARGLIVNPVDFSGGAVLLPAAPAPTLSAAPTLSSAIAVDWRALFGASAVRRVQADWPNARLTSYIRSPAHNAKVGGRPDSLHLDGLAGDFVLPPAERRPFVEWARVTWPGADVIDEGDHIHIEWNRLAELPLAGILLIAGALVLAAVLFTR